MNISKIGKLVIIMDKNELRARYDNDQMMDMHDALQKLSDSMGEVSRLWDDCNLDNFADHIANVFPFEHSMDSALMDVTGWCTSHKRILREICDMKIEETHVDKYKYKELAYVYENTGGNCMVGVMTIYDYETNRTLFVMSSEEGCTVSTTDYIASDIEYEQCFEVECVGMSEINKDCRFFELYRDNLLRLFQNDFRHYHSTGRLHIDLLPEDMIKHLTPLQVRWIKNELDGTVDTDGTRIIPHPLMPENPDDEKNLPPVVRLLHHMTNCFEHATMTEEFDQSDSFNQFSSTSFTIGFGDMTITLDNNADTYETVEKFLKELVSLDD